jgi:UDP-N-acetylmuramate-alanine ligase
MTQLNFNKKDIIHFIGIGGIGMSGIALILKKNGIRSSRK